MAGRVCMTGTLFSAMAELGAVRPVALAVAAGHSALSAVPHWLPHAPPHQRDLAVRALLRWRRHHLHQLRCEQVAVVVEDGGG